jgi:hypothetical protein
MVKTINAAKLKAATATNVPGPATSYGMEVNMSSPLYPFEFL